MTRKTQKPNLTPIVITLTIDPTLKLNAQGERAMSTSVIARRGNVAQLSQVDVTNWKTDLPGEVDRLVLLLLGGGLVLPAFPNMGDAKKISSLDTDAGADDAEQEAGADDVAQDSDAADGSDADEQDQDLAEDAELVDADDETDEPVASDAEIDPAALGTADPNLYPSSSGVDDEIRYEAEAQPEADLVGEPEPAYPDAGAYEDELPPAA